MLWCHGAPGAGKSTLVYAIIERLRKSYGKEAVIVYAYCSYEKQEAQPTRNILAGMVRMAASEYEPLPECVLEAWKMHDYGSSFLSLSSLRSLLCKLLTGQRKSFILVDALDEITDSKSKPNERLLEPDRVLDEVTTILKEVNKLKADHGQISCRALVTSREKCPDRFSRVEVAEMPIEAAEGDVKIRVEAAINGRFYRHLAENIQRDPKVQANMVDQISKSAEGVFLLPRLQLEYLRRFRNLRDLKDALKDLPQNLDDSHMRSMKRIRNQPVELCGKAYTALSLVYHAKGSLTLKSVQQALAVRDGDERFDEDGIDSEETLINITAGLLTMRSGNLTFVHHTVKEFLRTPEGKSNGHRIAGEETPQDWFTGREPWTWIRR